MKFTVEFTAEELEVIYETLSLGCDEFGKSNGWDGMPSDLSYDQLKNLKEKISKILYVANLEI